MGNKNSPFYGMGLTSAITSYLAGGPLAGYFIGTWLDNLFSTQPLFMVLTLILGIGAGTYGTIHLIRKHTGD